MKRRVVLMMTMMVKNNEEYDLTDVFKRRDGDKEEK